MVEKAGIAVVAASVMCLFRLHFEQDWADNLVLKTAAVDALIAGNRANDVYAAVATASKKTSSNSNEKSSATSSNSDNSNHTSVKNTPPSSN